MGINIGRGSVGRYYISENAPLPQGNPDPKNWKLIRSFQFYEYLLAEIEYPDCKNYEGRKILLYKGITQGKLLAQKLIDPHFTDDGKYHSPIARFVPTKKGWEIAVKLLECLANEK